jgi:hypothetical protein
MNRIQRIAAAAAVSATAILPATLATAYAEPYPWHGPGDTASQPMSKTKAQIEYEERLQLPASEPTTSEADVASFPWDTVGLAALGAGILTASGLVVLARRSHREPRPA